MFAQQQQAQCECKPSFCTSSLTPVCSSGVGYTVIIIALYVGFYYNVIIAWSLHYLFSSMTSELPWLNCGNIWNSQNCTNPKAINASILGNGTSYAKYKITPAAEYYE